MLGVGGYGSRITASKTAARSLILMRRGTDNNKINNFRSCFEENEISVLHGVGKGVDI